MGNERHSRGQKWGPASFSGILSRQYKAAQKEMNHLASTRLSFLFAPKAITYSKWLQNELVWRLWQWVMCPRNRHLWREIRSTGVLGYEHYLYCDACGREVELEMSDLARLSQYAEKDKGVVHV